MRSFALFVVLLSSRPLLACSVCGCDPSGGTLSLDRPTMRELRVSVEDRYLQKESGTIEDGSREGEREDRIDLRLQYSPPIPRLSLQLEVPFFAWKGHYGVDGLQDDTNQGLSDIAVTARWEAIKIGGLVPRHVIALIGSLKAPTGSNDHLAPVDEGVIDEHKQIGTGSWDEFIGAWYTYGDFPTVAYAGVTARINGSNSRGNHYGNALFGTLGVRRSFLEDKRLYFAVDAQGRNAGKDTTPDHAYDPNSGGFVGYAVGTAGYAITQDLLVRAVLQVPVVTALNGVQSEHPVGYLAIAYDLAL
ncbi:MAG TPA: hypothetical protein VLW85_05900 [Myxococcales bacterium]|nr:hypothetical protein [Myxococcales bacterium]